MEANRKDGSLWMTLVGEDEVRREGGGNEMEVREEEC